MFKPSIVADGFTLVLQLVLTDMSSFVPLALFVKVSDEGAGRLE